MGNFFSFGNPYLDHAVVSQLNDAQRGKILKAVMDFESTGVLPEFRNRTLRILFLLILSIHGIVIPGEQLLKKKRRGVEDGAE